MTAKKARRKTPAKEETVEVQDAPVVAIKAVNYKIPDTHISRHDLVRVSCWKNKQVAEVCFVALPATLPRRLAGELISELSRETKSNSICAEEFAKKVLKKLEEQ